METRIRVGIIGCGVIAPSHIDSYRQLENVEVTALCDPRTDRRTEVRRLYPDLLVSEFADLAALLAADCVDAVSICTDHASHEKLVLESLAAGKHVICEKALTTNRESLQRMQAAAEASPCVAAGIFQHRFDPVYRVLQRILEEGLIGRLLTVSAQHQCFRSAEYYRSDAWRGTWAGEGGSLLINQSIHFLDILQWVTGGVAALNAFAANQTHSGIIETEDAVSIALELRNGALGTFLATSSSQRKWDCWFQFVGTRGDIRLKNGAVEACHHEDPETQKALTERLTHLNEIQLVKGAKAYYGSSHPAQIRDFIEAIRQKQRPFVGFAEAAETMELVLAVYESARSGKVCRLDGTRAGALD